MPTVRDKMILDLERQRWKYADASEAAIRQLFDESPTRYYQRLAPLLDRPDSLGYDAQLVKRLQRLPDRRRAARRGATHGAASRPTSPGATLRQAQKTGSDLRKH
jgi:hypothetical protein